MVGSFLAKPTPWFLSSTALSVTRAVFETNVPNVSHFVPSVPPLLLRTDMAVRDEITTIGGKPLSGRIGAGYTLLSPRHLTDTVRTVASHILNAGVGLRYSVFELELEGYNVLDLEYADSADYYASNWAFVPGQQPASFATHLTAAPPLSVLATLGVNL